MRILNFISAVITFVLTALITYFFYHLSNTMNYMLLLPLSCGVAFLSIVLFINTVWSAFIVVIGNNLVLRIISIIIITLTIIMFVFNGLSFLSILGVV